MMKRLDIYLIVIGFAVPTIEIVYLHNNTTTGKAFSLLGLLTLVIGIIIRGKRLDS